MISQPKARRTVNTSPATCCRYCTSSSRARARSHLALYELEDRELEQLLLANAVRDPRHPGEHRKAMRPAHGTCATAPPRQALRVAGADVQPRMFNNATHIGHNKFVVHRAPDGPRRRSSPGAPTGPGPASPGRRTTRCSSKTTASRRSSSITGTGCTRTSCRSRARSRRR